MDTSDPQPEISIEYGICSELIRSAVQGYWQAFSRKLRYPPGLEAKTIAVITRVLDPGHAVSTIDDNRRFLCVAGFKTPEGAFIGGGFDDLRGIYGWVSSVARGSLVTMLERKCSPDTLLMDGVYVQPEARGRGAGKFLLEAIQSRAIILGLGQVRLDVIDTNLRARALYEREGFVEQSVMKLGLFAPIFGFSSASTMTKAVGRDAWVK